MKLDDIRNRIDLLDDKLIDILTKRMLLTDEVASAKIESGGAVYSIKREEEILRKLEGSKYQQELSAVMKGLMTMSRERQYGIIMPYDNDWQKGKDIERAKAREIKADIVAYSGKSGSYAEAAAGKMYPHAKEYRRYKSFYDAFNSVLQGETDIAVLPLENTTAGTVNEVYDLIPNSLYIVGSMSDTIMHSLLTVEGASIEDIHTIISHPQALSQCSKFIKRMGWQSVECDNTAYAAETVAEKKDKGYAAIGSLTSATVYGLKVLDSSINDELCNQTRFVGLSKEFIITPNANKVSIALRLPHKAGALAWVLFMFAGLDINLTKIQSRPITDRPWEYMFYIDYQYKDERSAMQALYQLDKELPELILLGWYKE